MHGWIGVGWMSVPLFECDCLHLIPGRNRCLAQSRDAKMVVLKMGQDGN